MGENTDSAVDETNDDVPQYYIIVGSLISGTILLMLLLAAFVIVRYKRELRQKERDQNIGHYKVSPRGTLQSMDSVDNELEDRQIGVRNESLEYRGDSREQTLETPANVEETVVVADIETP